MNEDASEETQTLNAVERIRGDILSGVLAPGARLPVSRLKTDYGFGPSPLREALSRLTSLGYVTTETNRGYSVSTLSQSDLADITMVRELVEIFMLQQSMQHRSDEWRVSVVAALERLRLASEKAADDPDHADDYVDVVHNQFHATLVGDCRSPRLTALRNLLWDQARRYRMVVIGGLKNRDQLLADHVALVDATFSGDVERASEALRCHLNITPRDVYTVKAAV